MTVTKIPMTQKGYMTMQKELKKLVSTDRKEIIQAIASARALGDLSENAEYHAAREKQSFVEGRISELEAKLSRAHVIDTSSLEGDTVTFGANVTLIDEDTEEKVTYQIVGTDESDIEKRLLSIDSPLARGIIGKKEGDSVVVRTPKGEKNYEISQIFFG